MIWEATPEHPDPDYSPLLPCLNRYMFLGMPLTLPLVQDDWDANDVLLERLYKESTPLVNMLQAGPPCRDCGRRRTTPAQKAAVRKPAPTPGPRKGGKLMKCFNPSLGCWGNNDCFSKQQGKCVEQSKQNPCEVCDTRPQKGADMSRCTTNTANGALYCGCGITEPGKISPPC